MANETVDKLAKKMADRIGHGMREKCYVHAEVAEEFFKAKTDGGATVLCSDGLSCPLLDECDAVSEAIGDKQILASALREIYNIRGEDKDIDRIVNEVLDQVCAT